MVIGSYILALDQGTTGSTALLFDEKGHVVSRAYREIRQIFPQPGWVEHAPDEIFQSCVTVGNEAVHKAGIPFSKVSALGITNQRESVVVWERSSGKPVHPSICWQCRRTSGLCEDLKKQGLEKLIRQKTGLPIDAYFSGTKIKWLLDNIPHGWERAKQGDLICGTIDTWLVWNLTKGKIHVTDYSNASRTMLLNISTLQWDTDLLQILGIPSVILPQLLPSSFVYGETAEGIFDDAHIPVAGIVGDQQASLFGQACHQKGMAKNTYGTGSFVLVNTGEKPIFSDKGIITTVAWGLRNQATYAMEGSIFITGAVIQWLRDNLGLIKTAAESETLAGIVPDNGGVYFVPAFVGLGAPHWDMYARGSIFGLTRGSSKGHLARAALEAIAYQTRDVIDVIKEASNIKIPVLRVDGGGSVNNLLMQFQADILGIPIQRAQIPEITALGAAYLAGLAVGVWQDVEEIGKQWHSTATFEPKMNADERETLYHNWKRAVERAQGWEAQ
ncbi:MAG: glycerol kinase GlpK [Dehalococcoidales bacterium]|nr:glycerol kinase GlpK [Dehalococcoidales bacterium]